jgi:predicted nucleic acid-binding protein
MINLSPTTITLYSQKLLPCMYLDSCCYSRQYDNLMHPIVAEEVKAMWKIFQLIENHQVDLAWSYVLRIENKQIRNLEQRLEILAWENKAVVSVEKSQEIRNIAKEVQKTGVHKFDALHIACAIVAHCQFFVTTDYRLQKYHDKRIYVCDPMECLEILHNVW